MLGRRNQKAPRPVAGFGWRSTVDIRNGSVYFTLIEGFTPDEADGALVMSSYSEGYQEGYDDGKHGYRCRVEGEIYWAIPAEKAQREWEEGYLAGYRNGADEHKAAN